MEAMTCNPGSDSRNDVDRLDEPPLKALPENGVYTIVVEVAEDLDVEVGSLGIIHLERGYYAYTGSGLGKGALSVRGRVSRHISRAKRLKWHIDFLLSHPRALVVGVVASRASKEYECVVALNLAKGGFVKRFGCSDCRCKSHLARLNCRGLEECLRLVSSVYKSLGLEPVALVLSR